ncbi:MAG TPA: hypothetical protein VGH52_09705 [Gaiellaceae bacterium]
MIAGSIVFIHVPKTGGSTFASILRRSFPASDVVLQSALKEKYLAEVDAQLRAAAMRPQLGSIHGHVPLSYRPQFPPEARYVTLLRDPVRRQYSHYRWVYTRAVQNGSAPPVAEALKRGRLVDNLQTRMLCGLDNPLTRPADDELLTAARAELDRLAFVGIVERFPESMLLAQERLGLRHVAYRRRNVRGTSHALEDVEALRAHNLLDLELYAHATALVEADLDRLRPQAVALARADEAMSARRLVADRAALGYVADYSVSAVGARIRRALAWR